MAEAKEPASHAVTDRSETIFQGILGRSRTFLRPHSTVVQNFRAGYQNNMAQTASCCHPLQLSLQTQGMAMQQHGHVKSVPMVVGLCPINMVNSLAMFQR